MTRQVLFNGAVLVRAGGATRVDASAFQNVGISGVGTVAVVGEADDGEPNVVYAFKTPQDMVETFKSGPLADAADLAFRPMNDPRVPGGAVSVVAVKTNQSTQGALTLVTGANDSLILTSKAWGADANKVSVAVSTSGSGKQWALSYEKGAEKYTEASPVLGDVAEFSVHYTGAGTAATMTVTSTQITTAITGAAGENLTISFAEYATLQEVINYINGAAGGVYTAVAIGRNPYGFLPSDLDYVSAVNIKTAAASFYAKLYRMIDWINTNSALVTAARATGGSNGAGAPDDITATFLTGGARGISSNSDWQSALDLLGTVRVNVVVPLISEDLTNQGYGSTATFASVVAATDAHAAYYSSTKGKSERQAYIGMKANKADVLAQAGTLQSPHTLLFAQRPTRTNAAADLVEFDEWGLALIAAGGRAGSVLGEPLVYKNIRASGLTQDSSWNPVDDGDDMILGGVTMAFSPPGGGGYKFDRVVTTYTKLDNDAYVEESIVMGWKAIAYDLRTQLEAIFTGVRALPATVTSISNAAAALLEKYRDEGQIVDSTLSDGTKLRAYRELRVTVDRDINRLSVIISPVSGINFELQTIFAVPATNAA